jgi:hypothetical protein
MLKKAAASPIKTNLEGAKTKQMQVLRRGGIAKQNPNQQTS